MTLRNFDFMISIAQQSNNIIPTLPTVLLNNQYRKQIPRQNIATDLADLLWFNNIVCVWK